MKINDFLGLLGLTGLAVAFLLSIIALLIAVNGILNKVKTMPQLLTIAEYGQSIALFVAVFCLGYLLITNAFEYTLVFEAVEEGMPWFYKLSGLWSGQSSSLMFWSFILSFFSAIFVNIARNHFDAKYPAIITLMLTGSMVFYLIPVIFINNPFEKIWQLADGTMVEAVYALSGTRLIAPMDGIGMNPSLRHPAMLLHPPTLYIGLIGFFIPYAFALTSLFLKVDRYRWIGKIYPVVIFSWIFLTAGMFLGSWWAYTILGWGGYWGWDAVEIAGLLPWLLSFGLIHSMQMQISGKDFSGWTYVFSGLIAFFILAGILITRSGILDSVHAYSAGVMGPVLSILILILIGPYIYLLAKNRTTLFTNHGLKNQTITIFLARVLNILILFLVSVIFIGQTFPLTSQLFLGKQISWNTGLYKIVSSPLFLAILVITAVFPLSDKQTNRMIEDHRLTIIILVFPLVLPVYLLFNTEVSLYGAFGFWVAGILVMSWSIKFYKIFFKTSKDSRVWFSLGIALVHLGLGFTTLGILGSENLSRHLDISIAVGEQVNLEKFSLFGQSKETRMTDQANEIHSFNILLSKTDKEQYLLKPELAYFRKINTLYSKPAIRSEITGDIQIILSEWENQLDKTASVRVNIQPLILWIWLGGMTLVLGGIVCFLGSLKDKNELV